MFSLLLFSEKAAQKAARVLRHKQHSTVRFKKEDLFNKKHHCSHYVALMCGRSFRAM